MAAWKANIEIKCYFLCILSKEKHLLIIHFQLCLTFERVSVMLKFLYSYHCVIRSWIMVMDKCIYTMRHGALFETFEKQQSK